MRIAKSAKLLAALLLAGTVVSAAAQEEDFNVAAGAVVTHNRLPADNYADPDGLKLTDGSAEFTWDDMVGWEGPETVELTVDLGEIHDWISYVAIRAMRSDGSDVSLPASAIISVSEDGELWEDLGMALDWLEGEPANDTLGTLVWADEDWAGYGQFVRVEVRPGGEGWTMLAEVEVGNGPVPEELAPAAREGEATTAEPELVSLGKSYTLEPEAEEAYPDENGKLTDGSWEYAWADMVGIQDPEENPVVTVDLGEHTEGITRVAGLFMRSFQSAVNAPRSLVVSVSDDGEQFRDVGLAVRTAPDPFLNEYVNSFYWEDLVNPVDARYVRVEIRARSAWTMIAEVAVQTGAAEPEAEEPEEEE